MGEERINIIEHIRSSYPELTTAEKKVADYILAKTVAVQFMSITQLAEECGVAEATVSRFCRTLDIKGFNAFKLELAKISAAPNARPQQEHPVDSPAGRRQEIKRTAMEAIEQTVQLLTPQSVEQAVDILERAPHVVCLGSGGSMILAQTFAHLFASVSPNFRAVSDSHSQLTALATMKEEDAVVLFSYSGATDEGLHLLELARSRKIPTILVTRFNKSPAAKLADIVLCCGSEEGPLHLGSIPAKIAQMTVMDILFQEYCARNRTECDENIHNVAAALSIRHV